jgi:hypothetical protein
MRSGPVLASDALESERRKVDDEPREPPVVDWGLQSAVCTSQASFVNRERILGIITVLGSGSALTVLSR